MDRLRLDQIRARLKCAQTGYAVHLSCGGECTPHNPIASRYRCHKCGNESVSYEDVAELGCWNEYYEHDVALLLRLCGEEKP